MMMITRSALVAAAVSAAALGSASSAWADAPNGSFDFSSTSADVEGRPVEGHLDQIWTFDPCGSNCVHATSPDFSADAHLEGNNWVVSQDINPCEGDPFNPGTHTVTIDKDSLAGTDVSYSAGDGCGGAGTMTINFVLTKKS